MDKHSFKKCATSVHGYKYDYSRVKYRGNKIKVEIICKEHSAFMMTPATHLSRGSGCPRNLIA